MKFRDEIGVKIAFGEFLIPGDIAINDMVFPSYFPNKSELEAMTHQRNSFISVASSQLYYTRWSKNRGKNKTKKNGFGFLLGSNDGYQFNEYWMNETRTTFDSVTSQNSGFTYPVDSVNHDFYDKETTMNFLQFGIAGYRSNQVGEHLSIQFGLKALANLKVKEITSFQFLRLTAVETYHQNYSVIKESATLIEETTTKTKSRLLAIDISFPVSLNHSIRLIVPKRNSDAERELIVPFHLGLEPVFNFTFLNGSCYTKVNLCCFLGTSMRF